MEQMEALVEETLEGPVAVVVLVAMEEIRLGEAEVMAVMAEAYLALLAVHPEIEVAEVVVLIVMITLVDPVGPVLLPSGITSRMRRNPHEV